MKEPVKNGKVQYKYEEIHIANTTTMPIIRIINIIIQITHSNVDYRNCY